MCFADHEYQHEEDDGALNLKIFLPYVPSVEDKLKVGSVLNFR